jgi:hypothetical protein
MVWMLVRDNQCINSTVRAMLQELRQGGVPEIQHDPVPVVLEQEAGARLDPAPAGANCRGR